MGLGPSSPGPPGWALRSGPPSRACFFPRWRETRGLWPWELSPEWALAAGLPRQGAPSVQAGPICLLSHWSQAPPKRSPENTHWVCVAGHLVQQATCRFQMLPRQPGPRWPGPGPSCPPFKTRRHLWGWRAVFLTRQHYKIQRGAAARTYTVHTKPHLSENGPLSRGLPRANSMASV